MRLMGRMQGNRSTTTIRCLGPLLAALAVVTLGTCAGEREAADGVGVLRQAVAGQWEGTGSMATLREGHTATLLPSGKVLVAGGDDCSSYVSTAELYDPANGTWATTGSMAIARGGHTATLLPNGKVLVAGGSYYSGGWVYLASAEVYDPSTGTWATTGSMAALRDSHTATLLPNGKVLVAGGWYYSGGWVYLASAEVYDPALGTWSATGAMANQRPNGHTATVLANGRVLVAGGYPNLAGTELYNPASGTWTATGSMATARYAHTATLLLSGAVLVASGAGGGFGAELYNPASGTWATTGSVTTARGWHTATRLPSGKVLVAGGYTGSNSISSAELYDPASGTWSTTGYMATPRAFHTATLLALGNVLAAGGYAGSNCVSSAELYDSGSPAGCRVCPGDGTCTDLLRMLVNSPVDSASGGATGDRCAAVGVPSPA